MAYTKQTWTNNVTPIDANHMNHIEDGIEGTNAFVVTFTTVDGGAHWTVDKTFSETMAAHNAGKRIIFSVPIMYVYFEPYCFMNTVIVASATYSTTSNISYLPAGNKINTLCYFADNSVRITESPDLTPKTDFVVTFTTTDGVTFTADKTFDETMAAHDNGQRVLFSTPIAGLVVEPTLYLENEIGYGMSGITSGTAIIGAASLFDDDSVYFESRTNIENVPDFVVTISTTDGVTFTPDKTFSETMAAHNAGKRVIFSIPGFGFYGDAVTFTAYGITAFMSGMQSPSDAMIATLAMTPSDVTMLFQTSNVINDPHPYALDGRNLKDVFGTASAFHTAVAAGDFSKIRVGDYWPITLTGNYRDYGVGSAAGEYEQKSFSNAVMNLEVAAINPYWRYGDSGNIANGTPHVLFISRDCLPTTLKVRKGNTLWEDESSKNPWIGSALYRTLNDPDYGIVNMVEDTDIGAYIYGGTDGNGMRYYGEKRDPITATESSEGWFSRGKLFLPTEDEIWGRNIYSKASQLSMKGLPIFDGSRRHIVKGLGDGGSSGSSRTDWITMSAQHGSNSNFCLVEVVGYPNNYSASYAYAVPLCFLVT